MERGGVLVSSRLGKAIASELRALESIGSRPFSISTKDDRIRIQKIVYLLNRLGSTPARRFRFDLYLHGPYSTELAEEYYALGNEALRETRPATTLRPDVGRTVLEADALGILFLEGLATTLYFSDKSLHFGQALDKAAAEKSHITPGTWGEIRQFIVEHPLLTKRV